MIKENIVQIRENIEAACVRAGRNSKEVTLIAVSKTKPAAMMEEAFEMGIRDFGENKVQEILAKQPVLPDDVRFHMIGHLQSNKIRQVLGKTVLIHSVDSIGLAEQIQAEAEKRDLYVDVLLEVNVANEDSKYGFSSKEVEDAIRKIKNFTHIHIIGLMTIAPFVENPEENRKVFKELYQLYVDIKTKNIDNVIMSALSMGMTGDYEIAIEEGATMIRVGTGIFGTR